MCVWFTVLHSLLVNRSIYKSTLSSYQSGYIILISLIDICVYSLNNLWVYFFYHLDFIEIEMYNLLKYIYEWIIIRRYFKLIRLQQIVGHNGGRLQQRLVHTAKRWNWSTSQYCPLSNKTRTHKSQYCHL